MKRSAQVPDDHRHIDHLQVERISCAEFTALIPSLTRLLHACVADGASISFIQPFTPADSLAFWSGKVAPPVATGRRIVIVARNAEALLGCVQLDRDLPPNQAHRAEVAKLLVDPLFRRLGIARLLMNRLEQEARLLGCRLLTLDTRTGDRAEPLYRQLGYQVAGVIPSFARDPVADRLDATTVMYKLL